jgi:hypothetical protein
MSLGGFRGGWRRLSRPPAAGAWQEEVESSGMGDAPQKESNSRHKKSLTLTTYTRAVVWYTGWCSIWHAGGQRKEVVIRNK